ncbi:MAG TPA: EAL domain-containing protein [Desulfuromonadales bacterium]|nr:EAL domain-containing protein [Desulfuromonadales bacterium]
MSVNVSPPVLLTIDDEEAVRSSIAAFFEDCGYIVLQACDGHEGIDMLTNMRPDVIITDLRMPNVDGLEVVTSVTSLDDNLPIVVLSGTGMLTDALQALRCGAWDYLPKPLADLAELEFVVNRCRERARLVSENRAYHENLELLVKQRTAELRTLCIAVEQSANSVVITDVNGTIEYVNPKFTEVSGYSSEEAIGRNPRILRSDKQLDSYYKEMWQTISSGREWQGEFCNKTKDGRQYWELCSIAPIKDEHGSITHYVANKEDITARKRHEDQLYYQANFDQLTGLPNRYYFQKYLELQLELVDHDTQFLTLMVLDIDNLKAVNDTFGHDFGDLLLKEIAHRMELACGLNTVVSRFVGDEFTVVPPLSREADSALFQAERIRSALNDVFMIKGTEITTSACIGVAIYPEDGECVESMLKNAEAAMYQAKRDGKNAVVLYTRELNSQLEQRFLWDARLRKALERDEFTLQYQPQVDQCSRSIVGVEALLRWTPAGESPVTPTQFIPILEENGLIVPVGEWVLQEACRQAVAWRQAGLPAMRISVNISALQFMRSDLELTVRRVLEQSGLEPVCLCLELTESVIMTDSDPTLKKLADLKEIGVTLSLDDFGTGYSSLAYLGRLPINELKIDISFVRRMLSTPNDAAVVNTIIAMGHGLGVELVAEGVETEEQLQYLLERGCPVIQGYYFSPPLTAERFVAFCGVNAKV